MKRFFLNNKRRTSGGFTLLETLIAVGLLMVAVVGPLTIAQKALSSSYYTRDRITAYYLAQDAIELVRSVRDNASLGFPVPNASLGNWQDFKNVFANCFGNKICEFDSTKSPVNINLNNNSGVSECAEGSLAKCQLMKYDQTTGWYNYDSGQPSIFRRGITITQSPLNSDEVQVKVTVSWRSAIFGPVERSFTLQDNLLNWQ